MSMTRAEEMSIQAVSPVSAVPGAAEVRMGCVVCAKEVAVRVPRARRAVRRVTSRFGADIAALCILVSFTGVIWPPAPPRAVACS